MTDGGLFLLAIIFISKTSLCLGDDYYYDYNYNEYDYDYDFGSPQNKGMKKNQTSKSLFNRYLRT